jgi:hypothetical protein
MAAASPSRHATHRSAWEGWSKHSKVVDASGRVLLVTQDVDSVVGDVVTLTSTKSDDKGNTLRVDHSRYRFLGVPRLNAFLTQAGFTVEAQYGDWQRGPITDTSREIVTIARRT